VQVQVELEQVELEQVELEQVELEQVQAELEQAPAQLHDQTILDAPHLREIYVVGPKQAWRHAALLLAPVA
jgi:hypothetical protein